MMSVFSHYLYEQDLKQKIHQFGNFFIDFQTENPDSSSSGHMSFSHQLE